MHKNHKMCIFALPEIVGLRYAMDTLKVVLTTKSIIKMNKIFTDQIQKSIMLVNGINANKALLRAKGINVDKVEDLTRLSNQLTKEGEKLDELLKAVSAQRKVCNTLFEQLKSELMTSKKSIKERFDQERWISLGITDKRL